MAIIKILFGIIICLAVLTGTVAAERPTVIITFDDGWHSVLQNAKPIMDNNSQKGVVFVITKEPELSWNGQPDNYMNVSQLQQLYDSGWDLSSHTYSHAVLTTVNDTTLNYELSASMDWLTHGFPRGAMFLAYPEGAYNSTVMAAVQANHYVAARTIDPPDANYLNYDLTSPDVYMLKAYEIIGGIGPDTDNDITVINQINNTIAANGLLILAFHKIVDNLSSDAVNASTEFTTSDFHNVSDYLKESNVSVMTMSEYFGNPAPIYTPTPTPVVTATPDNTTNTTTPTPTPTPAINETANVTVTATVTPNATVVPTPVPKGSSGSSGSSSGSSSGGGGGGGGGTSGENFSNIIVKERYDKDIYINKVTQYAFTRSENPIIYVNITGNVNAGEVNTAVEVLRDTSSFVKDPAPGKVNVNVNIWVGLSGFANPNNIKEAVIRFRVENSWFSSNNIKNSSIKMVRWDGGKWNPLETSEKSKDNKYTYFEAKTNAFSPFAITGVEEAASSTMPQVIAQPGVTGTAIPNSAVTGEAPSEGAPSINFAIIIAVFAMIGIVIAVHLKRRGNF